MNRRFFNQTLAESLLLGILGTGFVTSQTAKRTPRRIKPNRLRVGDTIGLITPSSACTEEQIQKSILQVESMGFKAKLGDFVREKHGFMAGTDEQRLSDLHKMFADNSVNGIWCIRGGYSCGRLLPNIDYKLIKKNPKILLGYSDVTALLQAIYLKTGLVGFHGPVAAANFPDYALMHLKNVLTNPANNYVIAPSPDNLIKTEEHFKIEVIRPGIAQGKLIGGNLSLISALAGTDYDWDVRGKLIFLEDVEERPYRIDRMLTQIKQSVPLEKAAGIVLGVFQDCQPKPNEDSLSLMETLRGQLSGLGIPVIYGLSIGHFPSQCTLPIGIDARLDTEKQTLTLLESAVI